MDMHNPISWENLDMNMWKALTTGTTSGTSATGGDTLIPESLDNVLHVTTYFGPDLFPIWKDIPKARARAMVEQANLLESYGDSEFLAGDFANLPGQQDSTYTRKNINIKDYSVQGVVYSTFDHVDVMGGKSAEQLETENKTNLLLERINSDLYFGNSSINTLEMDGFLASVVANATSDNIVDMRNGNVGGVMTLAKIDDGSTIVKDVGKGMANRMYLSKAQRNEINKAMLTYGRYDQLASDAAKVSGGFNMQQWLTAYGNITLRDDLFLSEKYYAPLAPTAAKGDLTKCPGAPTTVAGTSPADAANSDFAAGDAGDYIYKVVACNEFGASAPTASAAITVSADDRVDLVVTHAPGIQTKWFKVYRTNKNGLTGTEKFMFKFAAAAAATTTVKDYNSYLPGCSFAFMMDMSEMNMAYKQLLPYTKTPLAKIDKTNRWYQALWGALFLYAPKRVVVYKNLKDY
jgi:hypothetical protein